MSLAEGFRAYAQGWRAGEGEGAAAVAAVRAEAWDVHGVFGVPTCVLGGQGTALRREVLWGREHVPLVRRRLFEAGLALSGTPLEELLAAPYVVTDA